MSTPDSGGLRAVTSAVDDHGPTSAVDDPGPTRAVDDPGPGRSLDERYGWLYTSVWLIFLGFPLYGLLTADVEPGRKFVGIGLVLLFCAVYVLGSRRMDELSTRQSWFFLAALAVVALTAVPVFDVYSLAFAPFLTSWSMLTLPMRWSALITVACLLGSVGLAAVAGSDLLMYTFIIVWVALTTGGVSLFKRSGRAVEEARLKTQLASDRERVARDVHDVLGHSLTVVIVKAELARRLVPSDPDRAIEELTEIESLSRTALAEIRTTVGGLRETRLSEEVAAAQRILADAGIVMDAPDDVTAVDPRASVTLAWAVREAVTNIVRHSGAQQASIRWGHNWVEVTDDGTGISARPNNDQGHGLTGLRERIAAVGGTLNIESGPDNRGTRVRAEHR